MRSIVLLTAILAMGGILSAVASPVILFSESPPLDANWNNSDFFGGGAGSAELSDDGNLLGRAALRADVDGIVGPQADQIFAASGITGNWNTDYFDPTLYSGYTIEFDFYADTKDVGFAYPEALMVYMLADGQEWYYSLTGEAQSAITGVGWYDFSAPLLTGHQGDWSNTTGGTWGQSMFNNIEEVGIMVGYRDTADQVYGIRPFDLLGQPIPEPGAMVLLGGALLSLGMTFRKRLGKKEEAAA